MLGGHKPLGCAAGTSGGGAHLDVRALTIHPAQRNIWGHPRRLPSAFRRRLQHSLPTPPFAPDGARLVQGNLAYDALGASTTLSVGYAAHTNAAGTAVSASAAAYKAAAASTSAQKVDVLATIALGSGTETDANESGVAITVTNAGTATGSIELTIMYVVD